MHASGIFRRERCLPHSSIDGLSPVLCSLNGGHITLAGKQFKGEAGRGGPEAQRGPEGHAVWGIIGQREEKVQGEIGVECQRGYMPGFERGCLQLTLFLENEFWRGHRPLCGRWHTECQGAWFRVAGQQAPRQLAQRFSQGVLAECKWVLVRFLAFGLPSRAPANSDG